MFRTACILLLCLPAATAAQSQPHVTLELAVGLTQGTLISNACVSRLPPMRRYEFILHRGLNIRSIRDETGKMLRYEGYEGGRFVGEGVVYTVVDSVASAGSLCVEYMGAFPVYAVESGDFNTHDYKGFIAFNGRTVRAAEQSKWYPILYDSVRGTRAYEAVTYQATVQCSECARIYLNGDAPRDGSTAEFASSRPVQLLLFAGDFTVDRLPGLTVLNATQYDVPRQSVERLAAVVDSIRGFYEQWLGIPYGQPLVFLQHTIIENSPKRRWGFVTYPTIALSNDGVAAFVDADHGAVASFVWPYLGHEMAHYYFGTLNTGQGPYFWFLVESLAEYLALQTVRQFQGDSAFDARLAEYSRNASTDTLSVPFDQISRPEQIHDRYRYQYGPLLMVALEERVGIDAMRGLLGAMVQRPEQVWDYVAIRNTMIDAGVSAAAWQEFEESCIRPAFADGCLARYTNAQRE